MKVIFTGTVAALVLGAAIASAQTPAPQADQGAGAQAAQPSTQKPAGGAQTPATPSPSATQRPSAGERDQSPTTSAKGQTYKGMLRGGASGWTFQPVTDRTAGAAGAAGAATPTATSGSDTTFNLVAGPGGSVDFSKMANQCVEIVATPAPASGASSAGATPGAAGAAAGGAPSSSPSASTARTLTVTTIRAAEGCTP